jgi:DNA-binding NtrC family response regulator
MRILVVDHEKVKRTNLVNKLAAHGHQSVTVADGNEALEKLASGSFQLVFADPNVPGINGIELLRRIKSGKWADTEVVMMSSNGSIPVAVEAMKLGAIDFLKKPIGAESLLTLLNRIAGPRSPVRSSSADEQSASKAEIDREIIGHSESITRVKRMIQIAAKTDANVLIHGETGVGKDLVASVIHRQSHRRKFPHIKVGCTLLPAALIESELYGHEEGSFTGAGHPRSGRFELAEGGTIYLDDVDDIPLDQQAKLLRVIEEKVIERVGGARPIKANVRIVASTKLNLLEKISRGTFRKDLYYRLDVLRLRIAPLRNRPEDIPDLTEHLLKRIAKDQPFDIQPAAMDVLRRHSWPGNVRELYHTLERAWLIGDGCIRADLLEVDFRADKSIENAPVGFQQNQHLGFRAAMDFAEKQLLVDAMEACNGNKTAAAQSLRMKPSTFRDKLSKHDLM